MKRGVVYFISSGVAIKIGVTQNAVRKRLAQIQREAADELTVLATFPTPPASEFDAHQRFAHLRIGGEWFHHDQEILAYIEEMNMQGTEELRRQLKAIRDSDHPAGTWARNLMQTLDDVAAEHMTPEEAAPAMQQNTVQFRRKMRDPNEPVKMLTPEEIAKVFGLGEHHPDRLQ